uniref:Non-canonical E2 ubiquitin-conjugating enzyme C-terminal domain-containing protein n=1 Tax=Eutreptiella gymnastica TaxID=73025 RepID=A0A7S4GDE5_9EUGL
MVYDFLNDGCFMGSRSSSVAPEYETCDAMLTKTEFIPLRLTFPQRKVQRQISSCIQVCDYTEKVDTPAMYEKPTKRLQAQLRHAHNILRGLEVSSNVASKKKMLRDTCLADNANFFQQQLEYARRYKIMNPDLMRSEYPKFIYMLQDIMRDQVQEQFGFSIKHDIVTVHAVLKKFGKLALLDDPAMKIATTPVPMIKPMSKLNAALRKKDKTVKEILQRYSSHEFDKDLCEMCIRSIDDANCYVRDNAQTVDKMIDMLRHYFNPGQIEGPFSLAIDDGVQGSRLSHDHSKQYHFCHQSLTLWRNIARDMFRLWYMVEQDILDESYPYQYRDTGQGFNRVQQSSRVYNAMVDIVFQTKKEVGEWIGSDRVHIGDDQVPNGMMFIDKYTQVNRIINPILKTIDAIDGPMTKDPSQQMYIKSVFGGCEPLKKLILCDFFKHGFDGSGGDNMMDAGSCIDGRLTSAWNWCQGIKSKPFYPIFLLSGFSSFDGDF